MKGVVDVAQNVFAMYCVKRVINPSKVDPSVLVWAISRMCIKKGMSEEDALDHAKNNLQKLKQVEEYIALPSEAA